MSHHALKSGYALLADRLNRFPQGAPTSDTLYKILGVLLDEREAGLVALLPIKPFRVEKAAQVWHLSALEAQKVLEELAGRAILLDVDGTYTLPPPMAGFFEFSLMRLRGDLDQHLLSELYFQYLNVEEDFIRALFLDTRTPIGRTFVQEAALSTENTLTVLDYERASEVIRTAKYRAVGMCYCRHKMSHLDRACSAPMNICMTFGGTAYSLANHEYARLVEPSEGLDLLQQAYENNLVQFGENARQGVSFICNCCGCCCEAMIAARKFGLLNPIQTTNFLPVVEESACNGCGKCSSACPVEAMTLVSANLPNQPNRKRAKLNAEICLGCGVCVRTCPSQAISLKHRPQRVITPVNSVHRLVNMAIDRGMLANLIFDNQALESHRALAAILGVILKLPPIKQIMASQQMKSRYLEALLSRIKV